ncbi:MAG TPA: hypothetical protein VK206_16410 [Anaerolineales bacterium]|nr:hypothetical protein [Anaerolineales bacterium]HLO31124.1 hypothetical protein [Anaerolineales bacterium]
MTVDLQQAINSSLSLRLGSALAEALPPRFGYRVADWIAEQIARQKNAELVQAIGANQWVVSQGALGEEGLDQAVRETLRHSARCIFDLYHYIHAPEAASQLIVLDASFQPLVQRPEFDHPGLVIVGLHLSNFDLVLQWLCHRGMRPLVLTLPDPQGGRRTEYKLRRKSGINLMPTSVSAIRQALKHLRQGGMVLTGIDRPIPNPRAYPRFFGRPAALPIHHVFLATKAQVPVIIAATYLQQDGKYHVFASDFIEMDSYPEQETGTLRNAEKVLGVAEQFVRLAPHQWSVPLHVWPESAELF